MSEEQQTPVGVQDKQTESGMEQITVLRDASVTAPQGFQAGGLHCGLKRKRLDLGWIYSQVPAHAAGVYTTNLVQAAPLTVTRESVAVEQKLQAVLVNSANANACTGEQGLQDAYHMRSMFAAKLGVKEHHAAVVSTGVIGEFLPMDIVRDGIGSINTDAEQMRVENFEQAILTTDTCTKHIGVQMDIGGKKVTIGGAAKGSGMIEPNMATMLGFITTDAELEPDYLSQVLKEVTDKTFNMITVDGDTSTNDMVLVMANGLAGNDPLTPDHPDWTVFVKGLEIVCRELAKQIARDGEGATKLVEVVVRGASTEAAARAIGKAVVGSNLVKTAIFGEDANWGRIICAVGYSGEHIDPEKVTISLGPIKVVENGLPVPFSEDEAKAYLERENVQILVDVHQGNSTATAWGCDLTYEYVRINASYRT